uniref:Large ribosomal subunit protein uL14m n=2 Tax=Plectus sambesii TaxID=2011161 RepID=A0A914VZR9_9BILA
MSRHRSRPPNPGIQTMTRFKVVDNSVLGKQATLSGKAPYCIHVYKKGARQKHMPRANLGDKILVAIKGELKKAFVVGECRHRSLTEHGVPSTDSNNIVLIDDEGNPLGTRILAPIPSALRARRDHPELTKLLALATKFV